MTIDWEWIDKIQDIITLFGVPIAIYLLWNIYIKVDRLTQNSSGEKPKSGLSAIK